MIKKSAGKILIITSGKVEKLELFLEPAKKMGLDFTTASFSDLEYVSQGKDTDFKLQVDGKDVASFNLIYVRLVGKSLEEASLLVSYAKEKGVKVIDPIYEKSHILPPSISKVMELKYLIQASVPIPPTIFGSLAKIKEKGKALLGTPFVIKSTQGRRGREVWSPKTHDEFIRLIEDLSAQEEDGKRFFAQKFVAASQRIRVLVVGGKALAALTMPTKWRRRFITKVDGEYPERKQEKLSPIPKEDAELALAAARAVSLDIAGVDILHEDKSDKRYVIEVNAAPRWEAVRRDTEIDVEKEILEFLAKVS
ncbi:hypothetical protein CMO96_03040 [Candidatus Woesebacteria bacterium]|nr:hypothetical protein [Candidatus Woesebacteria bacterium]